MIIFMNVETPLILQMGYFLLCGIFIGLFYEVLRILRLAVAHNAVAVGVEDALFITLCAPVLFGLSMEVGNGSFRLLYAVSALAGAVLYYFTAGKLIRFIYSFLFKVLAAIFGFVYKKLILPFGKTVVKLAHKLLFPFVKIYKKAISSVKVRTEHLKLSREKSYNKLYNSERNEKIETKHPIKAKIK